MTLKKEQQRVYEWISNDLGLPVFAEAYKGAIFLLNQKPAGYVPFVAHVGRDFMTRLASTVSGIKSGRVQYQQHLDILQAEWQAEWRMKDDLTPEVIEHGHFIPTDVCQRIAILIEEHKSGRLRSTEADGLFFSTFLDYNDKNRIPKNFFSEWKAAKKWFLKHVHLREKSFNEETENEIVKHFNCLDSYLYIAASSQYERLKELNEILDITNQ
jgi:hypothetical protein